MMRVMAWCFMLLWGFSSFAHGSEDGAGESPQQVVEDASRQILGILEERRDELQQDREALYAVVDSVLKPRFDLVYAGRVVLGKYGRDATPKQRGRFINAFYDSLLRSYADGLLEFRADNLRLLPFRGDADADKARVRTEVILSDGRVIPVDYSLRLTEEGWKAYDVTIEGISYLTNYRKEVGGLIRDKGLDAVISELESRGLPDSDG